MIEPLPNSCTWWVSFFSAGLLKTVETLDHALFRGRLGHRRLRVVLIVDGEVIEDVLFLAEHPAHAFP